MTAAPTPSAVSRLRRDLLAIVRAGLDRVDATRLVRRAVREHEVLLAGHPSVSVVAVGKAACPMARGFASAFRGDMRNGLIIAPHRCDDVPDRFEMRPGGHPVPDPGSEAAARRVLEIARAVGAEQGCLVVLLSGGASALMALPAPGLDLAAKAAATGLLLRAGVPIQELNCVRKHLSAIKGGRLAAAAGVSVTLAISDVVGPPPDDPSAIGSGPTVADPTTFAQAKAVVETAGVQGLFPPSARAWLERGCRGEVEDTIKADDPRLARSSYRLIGNRLDALEGARADAEARGYTVLTLDEPLVGEARAAGDHLMRTAPRQLTDIARPCCMLSAGETTVRVRGTGKGGRNQEVALAAAIAGLRDTAFAFASLGTDGIDGPSDAAGAVADSTTLERATRAGLGEPIRFLEANDSYNFFDPLGDLIRTGPTHTNVGDLQVLLVGA